MRHDRGEAAEPFGGIAINDRALVLVGGERSRLAVAGEDQQFRAERAAIAARPARERQRLFDAERFEVVEPAPCDLMGMQPQRRVGRKLVVGKLGAVSLDRKPFVDNGRDERGAVVCGEAAADRDRYGNTVRHLYSPV